MRYLIKVLYVNGEVKEYWVGGDNPDEVTHAWIEDCRDDSEWRVDRILSAVEDPVNVD